MDPDVIEIPPPIPHSTKPPKQKQVILHEVIDVDKYEDFSDVVILDEKVDTKNKGKAITNSADGYNPSKENMTNFLSGLDDFPSDLLYDDDVDDDYEDYIDLYSDDLMDFDDYGSLQAQFDNVDIPPGVEATIPWLPDPSNDIKTINGSVSSNTGSQNPQSSNGDFWLPEQPFVSKEPSSVSSSGYDMPMNFSGPLPGLGLPFLSLPQAAQSKKISTASQHVGLFPCITPSLDEKTIVASSTSTNYHSQNHFNAVPLPPGVGPFPVVNPPNVTNQGVMNNAFYPSVPKHAGGVNHHHVAGAKLSWFKSKLKSSIYNHTSHSHLYPSVSNNVHNPPEEAALRTSKNVDVVDVLRKFELFKRFDTVEDHSDHHYASNSSSTKQPPKNWVKKIQDEWRILENDLPDNIFVRVYETRMDLLRAVIVGAEGTPYHDGLFFFDVFFPNGYPNVPPHVYYHSGGLRLNPNLYSNGKVCLSLLGTWHGNKNEKWIPGVSTVLQVLVSIQALILNQKPFFNEPGYERLSGSTKGEIRSQQYNENTFILSLKTMVYAMRRPPKHFEDFVMGHFHMRARDILVACKAYMDGAQVGCLVKGGVQDVDEGDKSCSKSFKETLPHCVTMLAKEFSYIGVKDSEALLQSVMGDSNSNKVANMSRAAV